MKDTNNVEKIMELFDKYDLSDFSYKDENIKISLKKENAVYLSEEPIRPQVQTIKNVPETNKVLEENISSSSQLKEIVSPINGNFYRSPSPGAEPFVNVGDTIKEGQVICIVESMKLMNEIKSSFSGKIVELTVEDGKPVSKGQVIALLD